jgi:hypothetical protein
MRTRTTIFGVGFLLAAAFASTTSCTQPSMYCTSAHEPFAAEYTLTKGDPSSPCGRMPGDVLGMHTYYQTGGPNGTPDYGDARLAIRPTSLGSLIDYAEANEAIDGDAVFHDANAIGSFTAAHPDDDDFCMVDEFADATVSLPSIEALADDPATPDQDESQPARAATAITYRWSNARLLVSADAQGTQFEADLEYVQDDCTAEYHVVGVSPAVKCENDEDCDDEKNGINPDFAVRCNTQLGLCVLDDELPAYE